MSVDESVIKRMLADARRIAVVGLSEKTHRVSHSIARYLSEHGYHVVGVNPSLARKSVMGMACYGSLAEAEAALRAETGGGIDLVNVFRAPEHVPAIVDQVIQLKIPWIWLQDEVRHPEAVARARAAGVQCVEDDCIYRWHLALVAGA